MWVRDINFVSVSTFFRLDFKPSSTVWYLFVFHFIIKKNEAGNIGPLEMKLW